MCSTRLEVDEDGFVAIPHHDGRVLSIALHGSAAILQWEDGGRGQWELSFDGVKSASIVGHRSGSIILSMVVVDDYLAAQRFGRTVVDSMGLASDERPGAGGCSRIFLLLSSYGGDLAIQFDSAVVRRIDGEGEICE